jgi:hypothetical protein
MNYKLFLEYSKSNPKMIGKTIGPFPFTTRTKNRPPTTLTATTWGSKHAEHRRESFKGPPNWRLREPSMVSKEAASSYIDHDGEP